MERLKHMKECLMCCLEAQMNRLDEVDAKEMGEVVDMVKDLEEAIYYCTITKAMEGKEKSGETHHYYTEYRDMDRPTGRMYYSEPSGNNMGSHTNNTNGSRTYMEWDYPTMRDTREGKSYMSRKTYMESREMHQPKTTQMKELEKYLQELSSDIVEMIQEASPEEKAFLEKKISALATKVNQMQ